MYKVLEKNLLILKTPLTDIWIEDSKGNKISFDIIEREYKNESTHTIIKYDENNKCIEKKQAENFKDLIIRADITNFNILEKYYIKSSEELEFVGSDEYVITYGIEKKDKVLAISYPEINEHGFFVDYDNKKLKFYTYEELQKFVPYDIDSCLSHDEKCNKFEITVFNKRVKYLYFGIAWIENVKDDGFGYLEAVEIWSDNHSDYIFDEYRETLKK